MAALPRRRVRVARGWGQRPPACPPRAQGRAWLFHRPTTSSFSLPLLHRRLFVRPFSLALRRRQAPLYHRSAPCVRLAALVAQASFLHSCLWIGGAACRTRLMRAGFAASVRCRRCKLNATALVTCGNSGACPGWHRQGGEGEGGGGAETGPHKTHSCTDKIVGNRGNERITPCSRVDRTRECW